MRGARPPRATAERTGLPISFHLKGGTSSGLSYQMGKWQSAAFATVLPLQLDEPLATMMFCGALERHSLRDKIDDFTRIPPSELFRRQVMATFEEDALVTDLVPLPGADSCMWASDSPHTDRAVPLGAGVLSACLSSAGPGR